MTNRPTFYVDTPPGGWLPPWPLVAEFRKVFPHDKWSLVGGLMAQLHALRAGIASVRPTNDVDLILHIETERGVVREACKALEELGYSFLPAVDSRNPYGHRFTRGGDVVDLLIADHAAPSVVEELKGKKMIGVEGGTSALRRTANYEMRIHSEHLTTISVPSPLAGAVVKSAAHRADTRDRERHLHDAAVLLACIEDPFLEKENLAGSDRKRLLHLQNALGDREGWLHLPSEWQSRGRAALRIMLSQGC